MIGAPGRLGMADVTFISIPLFSPYLYSTMQQSLAGTTVKNSPHNIELRVSMTFGLISVNRPIHRLSAISLLNGKLSSWASWSHTTLYSLDTRHLNSASPSFWFLVIFLSKIAILKKDRISLSGLSAHPWQTVSSECRGRWSVSCVSVKELAQGRFTALFLEFSLDFGNEPIDDFFCAFDGPWQYDSA